MVLFTWTARVSRLVRSCAAANTTVPRKPDLLYSNIYSVHFVTSQKSVGRFYRCQALDATRHIFPAHNVKVFCGCIFFRSKSIHTLWSILNGNDAKRVPIDSIKFVRLISTEHGRNGSNANDSGPSSVLNWYLCAIVPQRSTFSLANWHLQNSSSIFIDGGQWNCHTFVYQFMMSRHIFQMEYRSEASLLRSQNQNHRNANEWMKFEWTCERASAHTAM